METSEADLQAKLEAITLERQLSETLKAHEKTSEAVQDQGKENVANLA